MTEPDRTAENGPVRESSSEAACAAKLRFQVAACGGLVLQRAVRALVVVEAEVAGEPPVQRVPVPARPC